MLLFAEAERQRIGARSVAHATRSQLVPSISADERRGC